MNNKIFSTVLKRKLSEDNELTINVSGISMMPTILSGDKLIIQSFHNYHIGDVLVFFYGKNKLLVHRLLKINNAIYYCKGDNSFRIEQISSDQIIGKVVYIVRNNEMLGLPETDEDLINMSYLVNEEFTRCGYDITRTKQSKIYREYEQKYL